MNLLQELKKRLKKAEDRERGLAAAVEDTRDNAARRRELEEKIEAEQAAAQIEALTERFKTIVRELPVLAFEFDQQAHDLLRIWNGIHSAHSQRETRLTSLLHDHGLGLRFDTSGRKKDSYSGTLPAWVPCRTRLNYDQDGKALGVDVLTNDLYGVTLARAMQTCWKLAESGTK